MASTPNPDASEKALMLRTRLRQALDRAGSARARYEEHLEAMTVVDLRGLAKELGHRGCSSLGREPLLTLIRYGTLWEAKE